MRCKNARKTPVASNGGQYNAGVWLFGQRIKGDIGIQIKEMMKKIQTPAYQTLYDDYDKYIRARDYKLGSGKMYQTAVKEFLIWMEQKSVTDIKEVTTTEMNEYFEYLRVRPNQKKAGTLASSTIKLHLLSIHIFMDNLLSLKAISKGWLIPRFGADDQKPRNALTVDEVKSLYRHAANPSEKALLSLAYGCGLRRSELQNLNALDVMLHTGMVIVRKGKGYKRREVPMSDNVLTDLKKYVTEHRQELLKNRQGETAFFIGGKGKRMSGDMMNKLLKKMIARTENQAIVEKEITLHCLRHSIANHLAERNAGLDFIRGFLGHSFINTAYIYATKNKRQIKTI